MEAQKKVTLQIPEKLLKSAQKCTGKGITATIHQGLRLVAGANAYQGLRHLRGKVKFSGKLHDLRKDR